VPKLPVRERLKFDTLEPQNSILTLLNKITQTVNHSAVRHSQTRISLTARCRSGNSRPCPNGDKSKQFDDEPMKLTFLLVCAGLNAAPPMLDHQHGACSYFKNDG
jgi:hypothetical protein